MEKVETRVCISASMDMKTRLKQWWDGLRLKVAMQHLGLLIFLMFYTVMGGLVFQHLERPEEVARRQYFEKNVLRIKYDVLTACTNGSEIEEVDKILQDYERILEDSILKGIPINSHEDDNNVKWTTVKAVFFSSTVLTTIGFGNIVPVTTEGRVFVIIFALVGIPLTLTVIADWGRLFASTVSTIFRHIPPLPLKFRNAMVARRTSSYALLAVGFLFVYLAAGAAIFVIWEEDWTFFEGFYFCFITMTTIGFGDFVPKQPKYMLMCTLYILVGLALTSTIIELVRRQYAQSWRQLQALRGPLAENFRKFADNAPGLDVMAFQQDLMKVLTVVTMPKLSKKEKKMKQKEWEDAIEAVIRDITVNPSAEPKPPPPMVQIVIYESSV
ncbi:TWiK family of potassium channels protein 7 [Aethina tumida]|uniref:TWiK family of potassium channels protein 7 n=1 Tax=Aethina tumida TaxID=116153 RepID=UPI0021496B93|nr:TWiK family of potassium channels protein 7 [Aethina tumida]